jgi:hypothetical protein
MSRRAALLSSIVTAGMLVATASAPLGAETIDKLTYLTFSGRVQVPGVKLDAGTYRFRLTNPNTDRNVIQVLSRDGSTVFAMFHTLPDSRVAVTRESTVTFRETPAGVPPVVKSLFYGGETSGYEFVYPKGGPDLTATLIPQPEITFTPAPAAVVEERSTRVETAPEPAPAPEPAAASSAVTEQAPPAELPHTASPLPLVALGGLASLIMGFGAGLIRRLVG